MKIFLPLRHCLTAVLVLIAVVACNDSGSVSTEASRIELVQASPRWYSQGQVNQGEQIFTENCAVCHGAKAEGIVDDWKQKMDDGNFPPPPLNGSAHAWHHPNSMLIQVINNGGAAFGGQMPPFKDVLEESEKLAAIAFFQSFWTDEIYGQWEQMGGTD